MQLQSFEIHNFRSIEYVKCAISPQITVLAGKNEAGKTTILQALGALNRDWQYKESDIPQHVENDGKFILKCLFKISEDQKASLSKKFGAESPSNISDELVIIRSNKEPQFVVEGKFMENMMEIISTTVNTDYIKTLMITANTALQMKGIPLAFQNVDNFEFTPIGIQTKINEANGIVNWINANNPGLIVELNSIMVPVNNNLTRAFATVNKPQNLKDELLKLVPRVILFSSFNDILPSQIQYTEFVNVAALKQNNRIVDDLAQLSGLDRQKLSTGDSQNKANLMNKASKISSDEFGKHWHQSPIEISFRADGPLVLFFIQDKGKEVLYRPDQRSKGLQWYISFFLRLTSEGEENKILLIDEPGLYLHAKAQLDVLGLLEELAEKNQIIFTTHSPYLIDASKLGRLRLVTNNSKTGNTEINNFNTNADTETLTPIITAIGLDVTKGFAFPNKKNVVVEGVSDYYYLQAMLHYLKNNEKYDFPDDIIFIPCVGNNNVGTVVSLLHAYGLNYKILLDRKGTAKTKNALIKDGIAEMKIISVGKNSSDSIEELFDTKDQKNYNILDGGVSKTLISRGFYDKITSKKDKHIFSAPTLTNFRELFNEIKND